MTRRIFQLLSLSLIAVLVLALVCNGIIDRAAEGKLYTDTAAIPYNKVGLLLGTSKFLPGGASNPYYQHRIEAAIILLKSRKIKYLIVSGDHREKYYNEPKQMKEDLLRLGVDSTLLFIDNEGIRTFDSIVRLKEIFGQQRATIISQGFHNQRAIYIASREGIQAIGFDAQDVPGIEGFKTQVREKLARIKVFIDFFLGSRPQTMGDKIAIP